nr:hypothetical protein [Tanacetum cinerariifolium]
MDNRLPFQANSSFHIVIGLITELVVKCDTTLGYTLVDLDNLGHKVDPFILASQARQVFYAKNHINKKLSIIFKTPPKNYKDTYDKVDEEFSTVIHQHKDNILPHVDQRELGYESRNDYYRTDCGVNIDDKLFGNNGKPLKVPRCGEGLDTIQGKLVGASCMQNTDHVDSCATDHINSSLAAHVIVIVPSLDGVMSFVVFDALLLFVASSPAILKVLIIFTF